MTGQTQTPETLPTQKVEVETEGEDSGNPTCIKSLWIKEHTWRRLTTLKGGYHLTWSEFLDMLIYHALHSGATPPECIEAIQPLLEPPSDFEKSVLHIGAPWWESAQHLEKLTETTQDIHQNLQTLIETLEDHAETTIQLSS